MSDQKRINWNKHVLFSFIIPRISSIEPWEWWLSEFSSWFWSFSPVEMLSSLSPFWFCLWKLAICLSRFLLVANNLSHTGQIRSLLSGLCCTLRDRPDETLFKRIFKPFATLVESLFCWLEPRTQFESELASESRNKIRPRGVFLFCSASFIIESP